MRRVFLLLAVALLAGAASGCGSTETPALTVDGTEISQDEFQDAVDALAAEGSGDGTAALQLEPGSTGISASDVANGYVDVVLVDNELEERGVEVTDQDREAAEASVPAEGTGLTEAGRDQIVEWEAARRALERAVFEEEGAALDLVCLRGILVETEVEAQLIRQALAAGEDFAQLAQEQSIDPQLAETGGDLGCDPSGMPPQLQEVALALEEDAFSEPILVEGFGVIVVQRVAAELEAAREALQSQVLSPLLSQLRADADVEVDPRYGRWDTEAVPPQIVPPEGPIQPTTTASPAPPRGEPPVAPTPTGPPGDG